MKFLKQTIIIIVFIFGASFVLESKAQVDPPNPCGVCGPCATICADNGCNSDACLDCIVSACGSGIPISSHIIWLLLSGTVYGFRVFKSYQFRRIKRITTF